MKLKLSNSVSFYFVAEKMDMNPEPNGPDPSHGGGGRESPNPPSPSTNTKKRRLCSEDHQAEGAEVNKTEDKGDDREDKQKTPDQAPAAPQRQLPLLVMQQIVRSMATTDLIQLRRTCKPWNQLASPQLRHRQVWLDYQIAGRADFFPTNQPDHIIPFSRFRMMTFNGGSATSRRLFDQPHCLAFVSLVGPHLTSLEISTQWTHHSTGSMWVSGLRSLLFNRLPVLTSLKLNLDCKHMLNDDGNDFWTAQELPMLKKLELNRHGAAATVTCFLNELVVDLLQAATGLESLVLRPESQVSTVLQFMRQHPTTCPSLCEFSIEHYHLGEETWDLLLELGRRSSNPLKLTKFKVSLFLSELDWYQAASSRATEFFRLQAPQLRDLEIIVTASDDPPPPPEVSLLIPELQQLETLHIQARLVPLSRILVEGDWHRLKSLWLDTNLNEDNWNQQLFSSFSSIVRLKIDTTDAESPEMLSDLAHSFPDVVDLEIRLSRKWLPHIWNKWPALERLDIDLTDPDYDALFERDPDSDLTGIEAECCKKLREGIADGVIDYEQARLGKTAPGIGDLAALRVIKISTNGRPPKFGDVSGYFGFGVPGSRLQQVWLWSGLSEKCAAEIRQRLGQGSIVEINYFKRM